MLRLSNKKIIESINKNELDVRKTGNGRWIDQKCTPDVVCAVADIVDTITNEDTSMWFTSKDVWFSDYARKNILNQFSKSDPTAKSSAAEYNKFYQQPLNLLAYANVLERKKERGANTYRIVNLELLEYIAMSDKNSLVFLQIYIKEVLDKSGLYPQFENFFNLQTSESFFQVKDSFLDFCHSYTNIKQKLEPNRIFPKVINPLANMLHKKGASRGRLSNDIITYASLMYNQENFRDIFAKKPKDVSRQDWMKEHPIKTSILAKFKSDSLKAKKYVRKFNDKYFSGASELHDNLANGKATQMHHIFPQHNYTEISGYVENIIALTPSQHFTEAHPNNNTNKIDLDEQEMLLKAKANTINYVTNHEEMDQIYSFDNFAHVLKVGFNSDKPESEYNDFVSAVNEINAHYRVDK